MSAGFVRPDLKAVYRITYIHRQIDAQRRLHRIEIMQRYRRWRRACGDDGVVDSAETTGKRLPRDARIVQTGMRQKVLRVSRHPEQTLFIRRYETNIVGFRIVKKHTIAKRSRIVYASRQRTHSMDPVAGVPEQSTGPEAADKHAVT